MAIHRHTVVWLDHGVAKVLHFNGDASEMVLVQSVPPTQHLHHEAESINVGRAPTEKDFNERICEAIADSESILLIGPASAKMKLLAHLGDSHPAVATRISAVEPLEHPSDGQQLDYARRYFAEQDRVRTEVGH